LQAGDVGHGRRPSTATLSPESSGQMLQALEGLMIQEKIDVGAIDAIELHFPAVMAAVVGKTSMPDIAARNIKIVDLISPGAL
jgi:hypothetical protein